LQKPGPKTPVFWTSTETDSFESTFLHFFNRLPRGLQDFLPNRDNLPLLVAAVDQGLNFKPLLLISHLNSLSSDQQGLTNGLNAKLFEVFLAAAVDPQIPEKRMTTSNLA